jgi:hypothetical protein
MGTPVLPSSCPYWRRHCSCAARDSLPVLVFVRLHVSLRCVVLGAPYGPEEQTRPSPMYAGACKSGR